MLSFLNLTKSPSYLICFNLCRFSNTTREGETQGPSCGKFNKFKEFQPKESVKRAKTPIGKLDELEEGKHPDQLREEYPPFPDATNPDTGEVGGPRGPEPTRYGDWERKGRVSDF